MHLICFNSRRIINIFINRLHKNGRAKTIKYENKRLTKMELISALMDRKTKNTTRNTIAETNVNELAFK